MHEKQSITKHLLSLLATKKCFNQIVFVFGEFLIDSGNARAFVMRDKWYCVIAQIMRMFYYFLPTGFSWPTTIISWKNITYFGSGFDKGLPWPVEICDEKFLKIIYIAILCKKMSCVTRARRQSYKRNFVLKKLNYSLIVDGALQ